MRLDVLGKPQSDALSALSGLAREGSGVDLIAAFEAFQARFASAAPDV